MEPFIFPTSFAQQRLWFLEQFDPGKSVFHLLYALKFDGSLNLAAMRDALNALIARHESLRTSFTTRDGEPVQAVARELKLELPEIDFTTLATNEAESEARRWWQSEGERPFNLETGPLLRAHVVRITPDQSVLVITMHHIISDGWSMGVFLNELIALYESANDGTDFSLPDLPVQYADYSVWQREWMGGEVLDEQLRYWRQHLDGAPAALEVATDYQRPAVQTFAGARLYTEVPASLADQLRTFSREQGVTLFMTLLAAFEVLLWRYSGQADLVVGIPLAGRSRTELEGLIGLFANTLPLRTDLSGNPTFSELLQRVREASLGAYAHQEMPFDKLVEELQPERSLSHSPLFQVIFALENTPPARSHKGVSFEWLEVERGTARTDLSLFMSDKGGALSGIWEYSTDLFSAETIREMISSYTNLLENLLQNPSARISALEIFSAEERKRLLSRFETDDIAESSTLCMHQEFEKQVEQRPDAVAVICGDDRLTYAELNLRANKVAHRLQREGIRPETPVGVYCERSLDMLVGLLGVLKSGGAYVPIDPSYPADRLAFMLSDSRVPVLLTQRTLLDTLPANSQINYICLDDADAFKGESSANPTSEVTPDNLAYIIYTSGSTGRPKGVEVIHRTVVHLFEATRDQLGFRAGDVWTVVHSSAFDFSVWEMWGCLLQGGSLVIVPLDVVQSPADLFELLLREQVTILNQTPSALRALLIARDRARRGDRDWHVRLIVCGGDALDQELAAELSHLDVPVWNFYGPTESSVWTTCGPIELIETEVGGVSIGKTLPGLQVYLLDEQLQPVPAGVSGEIFIGGAGLARGYSRRQGLTAEKFVSDPIANAPGKRLYRTGDLARHRRDGRIEFIGRSDMQVKLRGFRIELGEIETTLSEHPDVAQAVVLIREDRAHDQRLVAYIVTRDGSKPGAAELRKHLRRTLPDYMLPSAFVTLAEMPLTPNKKVDRRALPAPERGEEAIDEFMAPRTPMEELIAETWRQVLRLERIGIYENFFELGGHSLLATQVISRLRQTLEIDLPVRTIFECLTISELAKCTEQFVHGGEGLRVPPILTIAKDGELPLSFAQQRLWFLDQLEPNNPFYNIGRALRLRGPLDVNALAQAISHIIRRHESLRISFGEKDGTPFQRIMNHAPQPIPVVDIRGTEEASREIELQRLAAEEIKKPFELLQGPFLRAQLIRIAENDHVLVLTMHHIAADEWSLAILFRELTKLYNAFTNGLPSPLPPLPVQYADYAAWQRQWLRGEMQEKLVSYWRKHLAGAPTVINLPTDKPRAQVQSYRGAYELFETSPDLLQQLKQLSRNEGVTLFMVCLAAYQLLLSRWTNESDLLVGTDVANRNRLETEGLIGFFTNLLPLRATLTGDEKFSTLLRHVRETTLEAYAHQDLPFEKLVEELRPQREPGRNPLVQVLLVMQTPEVPVDLSELEVTTYDLPLESSRFDIVLFLSESEQGLSGFWLYNPDLFEAETVHRLLKSYEELLQAIVAEPAQRLDAFDIKLPARITEPRVDKQNLQLQRANRLKNIRRKTVDLAEAGNVRITPLQPEQTLPMLIEPATKEIDLAEWAAGNRTLVEENLLRHGALLFRGFAIDSVPEFEKFASALCPELFGEYGDLPREELGGKVYGSTPYPSDEAILFHNESSHMHQWPMLIWFYCVRPSHEGGESPIIDGRRIYQSLNPIIREKFESKGLLYVRNFTDGLDVSWQDFFHTSDRSAVERYCREAGIDFEWKGNNGLRTSQFGPAVIRHPRTGELVFFNQLQLHHIACLASAVRQSLLSMMPEEDLPRNVYYGDGSRIEASVMDELGKLYQTLAVKFPWQKHDVLMLNNMLVAHSRNPYVGERKIVVALGNLVSKSQIEQPQPV